MQTIDIFPPKSLALNLKKAGFNEPCIAVYTDFPYDTDSTKPIVAKECLDPNSSQIFTDYCNAPTYDQVVGWFASKGIDIIPNGSSDMTEYAADVWNMQTKVFDCPWFANRQTALLTAFEEALKLIPCPTAESTH